MTEGDLRAYQREIKCTVDHEESGRPASIDVTQKLEDPERKSVGTFTCAVAIFNELLKLFQSEMRLATSVDGRSTVRNWVVG